MQLIVIGSYGDLLVAIYWARHLKINMIIPKNFQYLSSCLDCTSEVLEIEGPISFMNIKLKFKEIGFYSLISNIFKETLYLIRIKNKIILGTTLKCVFYGIIINAKILLPVGNIYSHRYHLSRMPISALYIIFTNKINCFLKFKKLKFFQNKKTIYTCFPDSRVDIKNISNLQIEKISRKMVYRFGIDYYDFKELIDLINFSESIVSADSLPYHIAKYYDKDVISIVNVPYSLYWVEEKNAYKITNSETVITQQD
ncbi:hypothetical protein G6659_01690 [Polynucleobacter paneuropaeus]|nr:hypothetical protein G6659_01690 [Polynucleobacter paneuropaeus]